MIDPKKKEVYKYFDIFRNFKLSADEEKKLTTGLVFNFNKFTDFHYALTSETFYEVKNWLYVKKILGNQWLMINVRNPALTIEKFDNFEDLVKSLEKLFKEIEDSKEKLETVIKINDTDGGFGNSFYGHTITTTVADLEEKFGKSSSSGDGKVYYEWDLLFSNKEYQNEVFFIYDWKEPRKPKKNDLVEFHIGAKNEKISKAIFEAIKSGDFKTPDIEPKIKKKKNK